jgi:hypothetical protein
MMSVTRRVGDGADDEAVSEGLTTESTDEHDVEKVGGWVRQ